MNEISFIFIIIFIVFIVMVVTVVTIVILVGRPNHSVNQKSKKHLKKAKAS